MKMCDIEGLSTWLPDTILVDSSFWTKEVATIHPVELYAFLQLHKETEHEHRARRELGIALAQLRKLIARSELNEVRIAQFRSPEPVFTNLDLTEILNPLEPIKRKAVLFTLESGLSMTSVIVMKWADVGRLDLSLTARALIESVPRHIRCSYIFYDRMGFDAIPLMSLDQDIKKTLGIDLTWLRYQYENMIWVDEHMAESFKDSVFRASLEF